MSDQPLITPSPLRRVLLRTALFVVVAELVCLLFSLFEGGGGKTRLVLLFGLGMAVPAAMVATLELLLRGREPSLGRAALALPLGWLVGSLGVFLALCQAVYADQSLGAGPEAGLEGVKDVLGRVLDRGPMIFVMIAVPFGPGLAARIGLTRVWLQALACLLASVPLGLILGHLGGMSGGDRAFAFMMCLAGAFVLPAFGALADRAERWMWPPEPSSE